MNPTELRKLSPRDFQLVLNKVRQDYANVLEVASDIKFNPMAERIRSFFNQYYPEYKQPVSRELNVLPRKVAIYLLQKHTNLQDKDKVLFLGLPIGFEKCYHYRKSVSDLLFIGDEKTVRIVREFEIYIK